MSSITRRTIAAGSGALLAVAVVANDASAHTGLGTDGALAGATHPLLGIDHVLAMVAVGVLAATAKNRRIAWLTPAGFVGGMVLGGLLGFAGIVAPGVELAIAATVVALGALVAVRTSVAGWWLPLVAAAFGLVHGHAHGTELPAGAAPVAYLAGFVLATTVLHLAGAGIGIGLRRTAALRVAAGTFVSAAGVLLLAAS